MRAWERGVGLGRPGSLYIQWTADGQRKKGAPRLAEASGRALPPRTFRLISSGNRCEAAPPGCEVLHANSKEGFGGAKAGAGRPAPEGRDALTPSGPLAESRSGRGRTATPAFSIRV